MSEETNKLTEKVIGAAIEVHRHFGPGFLESTYHSALLIELDLREIPFRSEVPVELDYKGHKVGQGRIDLLVDERLVVELKSTDTGPKPVQATSPGLSQSDRLAGWPGHQLRIPRAERRCRPCA
ncbi:MAG: GxxExxY protein [Planctomycetota bacterium]